MSNLPARQNHLPEFPASTTDMPADIRAQARSKLIGNLGRLQDVIDYTEKDSVRVQAIRLNAAIAGVLDKDQIARDLVNQKIKETALYLQEALGADRYETLAAGLSRIWGDL